MKIIGACCLQAALAAPQDDDFGLLSLRTNVDAESSAKHLLEAVGSRNVTQMASLVQELAKESLDGDGVEGLDEDIKKALYVIRGNLVTAIRSTLLNEHKVDQDFIMEQLKCFSRCEHERDDAEKECKSHDKTAAKLDHEHVVCRQNLMARYVHKIEECNKLDDWVEAFELTVKPREYCVYDAQYKCHSAECKEDSGVCTPAIQDRFGSWLQTIIQEATTGYIAWEQMHKECRASYHAYIQLDSACDVKQAEFEQEMCAGRQCKFQACPVEYTACRERCLEEYHRTVKRIECAEKDRKIDWSATEKIECYLRIILASPTDEELQANCQDPMKCINEWRTKEYNKCNRVCKEVDFDTDGYSQHARRDAESGPPLDYDTQLHKGRQHKRQHADNDIEFPYTDVTEGVNTTHRGDKEKRCTQHLDIDFQPHPCARPCPPEPPAPCDDNFVNRYYAKFLAMTQIESLSAHRKCNTEDPGEHTEKWAFNLCECRPCSPCTGGVYIHSKGEGCRDPGCSFPFVYEGELYATCTTANHHVPWCPTKTNNGAYIAGEWKNCESCQTGGALLTGNFDHTFLVDDGKCRTTGCAFPFTYEGVKYDSCTSVKHTEAWCATETGPHGEYTGKWQNCGHCTEAASCVGDAPLVCEDYFGDMDGLVTVADPTLGVPGYSEASGKLCGSAGEPCTYIHYAGLHTQCVRPAPPDTSHKYHKVTYGEECREILAKLDASNQVDSDHLFNSDGVLIQCEDFVKSNEVTCWGPPADNPQRAPCPKLPEPKMCCRAFSPECMACTADMTVEEYCAQSPKPDVCPYKPVGECKVGEEKQDSPCEFSHCIATPQGGMWVTAMISCAWPICPGGVEPVTREGDCCPHCPEIPEPECKDGEREHPDPCTTKICEGGNWETVMMMCAMPICEHGEPVSKPDQCCPSCPEPPRACCRAMNVACMSCSAGMTEDEYCAQDPRPEVCPCDDCGPVVDDWNKAINWLGDQVDSVVDTIGGWFR